VLFALQGGLRSGEIWVGLLLGGGVKDLFLGIVVDPGVFVAGAAAAPSAQHHDGRGAAWLRAAAARLMCGPARR